MTPRTRLALPLLLLATPQATGQSVAVTNSTPVVGEHVDVAFAGSNDARDWLGLFVHGAPHGAGTPALAWAYTNGRRNGTGAVIPSGSVRFLPLNLPPARYDARLCAQSGTTVLAATTFSVVSGATSPAPEPAGELTVMSFNVWVNAQKGFGGLQAVVDAIVKARADVVGLQETDADTLARLLALLRQKPGYAQAHGSPFAMVLSRLPIQAHYLAAGLRGYGVKLGLPSGAAIRFFNSHLTAYPYGPYTIRDGGGSSGSVAQALADEQRTRLAEARDILTRLIDAPASEPDLPTFWVGDHNTPSHLDWTAANAAQNFGVTVVWPVSQHLAASGFRDLYRDAHQDPTADRAFTWSPGYPKGQLAPDDVHDRIDMIYFRPGRTGPRFSAVQAYTFDEDPWPADHRAVVVSVIEAGSYRPFGAGCPGSAGTPALAPFGASGPVLGQTFVAAVAPLPPGAPVALWTGLSRASFGARALPLDLGPLGAPGCLLHVRPDVASAATTLGGQAFWWQQIPSTPALLGAAYFQQALVLDRPANALGAVLSNGAAATLGF